MIKIFIAENIPTLNKGELALLKGMLKSFKIMGNDIQVKIISSSPENDQSRYGDKIKTVNVRRVFHLKKEYNYSRYEKIVISIIITLKHILFLILYKIIGERVTKIMKSQIWKEYLGADIILVGHNGIFGICSGLIGNIYNFLTFLSYLYLPFFGKIIQKPLVIYGSSIPLYSSSIKRKWMSFLLNRIDLITLRETKSLENLTKLNYNAANAYVTADLAFLMHPESDTKIEKIMKLENIDKDQILVGVTVTRYKAITAFKEVGMFESYNKHSKVIANVLDHMIETKNAKIIFLPHSVGLEKIFDDRILSEHIYGLCRNKDQIKVIKNEYGPEELKGLMKKFDLFIGERIHSVIGAMSMNIPSIVLSNIYDQRLEIIRNLGQKNSICYVEGLKEDDLINKIDEIWEKRDEIKKELEIQIEDIKQKSEKNGILLKKLISK